MRGIVISSFIFVTAGLIGYTIGQMVGSSSFDRSKYEETNSETNLETNLETNSETNLETNSETNLETTFQKTAVSFECHRSAMEHEGWYFPCTLIFLKIHERNKEDECLSVQVNGVIREFLARKSASVEYVCQCSCVYENYDN